MDPFPASAGLLPPGTQERICNHRHHAGHDLDHILRAVCVTGHCPIPTHIQVPFPRVPDHGLPHGLYLCLQERYERQAVIRIQPVGQKPFCLLLEDINDFKQVNDAYGHDAGDLALRALSRAMRTALRSQDLISCWERSVFDPAAGIGHRGRKKYHPAIPERDCGSAAFHSGTLAVTHPEHRACPVRSRRRSGKSHHKS